MSSAYREPHTRGQHRAALTGGMTRTTAALGHKAVGAVSFPFSFHFHGNFHVNSGRRSAMSEG
jgi:hypothetical protein